jgi:hypothetical protein
MEKTNKRERGTSRRKIRKGINSGKGKKGITKETKKGRRRKKEWIREEVRDRVVRKEGSFGMLLEFVCPSQGLSQISA